jgi:hypothetical protein
MIYGLFPDFKMGKCIVAQVEEASGPAIQVIGIHQLHHDTLQTIYYER